ncbi:MAG: hypothetical protein E6093_07135 [Serratia liquefaciens]|nr:hypothetical protein [Serratia liquefaciens]HEJ7042958.1 hypothetical protein [Serratia liquefaciens]
MKVSDGVAVLILTSLGYLCTYAFEVGYCMYYGIPKDLIQISATNILVFSFAIIGLFCFLIRPLEDYLNFKGRFTGNPWGKAITTLAIKYIVMLTIFTLTVFLFPLSWVKLTFFIVTLAYFALKDFYTPLDHKHLSTYKEKLEHTYSNPSTKDLLSFIKNEDTKKYYIISCYILFLTFLSSLIGGLNAKFSDNIITCNDTYQVLKVYGDNAIVLNSINNKKTFKAIPITECTFETKNKS